MPENHITIRGRQIAELAARFPANPIALALAVEGQGVGAYDFRLPTRQLARLNFLPGWTRQNYRTAIAGALDLGLFVRVGPSLPGRSGARYRLHSGNGLKAGPAVEEGD